MTKKKTTIEFRKELKKIQPDILVLGRYVNNKTKIKVQDKYGACDCVSGALLQGHKPSIITALNRNDYFMWMAKEVHGDKYDYSKIKYKNDKTKVIIICPKHGEFLQTPNSHLRGDGCPKCGNTGVYNHILAERNRDKWENTPAIVYFIKCWNENEEFFKIGITTKCVNIRFSGFEYRWESIREINTNLYDAVYLEKELHEQHKKYKYTPKISFGGHTECFSKLI